MTHRLPKFTAQDRAVFAEMSGNAWLKNFRATGKDELLLVARQDMSDDQLRQLYFDVESLRRKRERKKR
jgi:hypothetical protein